jgi:hypothetical protein
MCKVDEHQSGYITDLGLPDAADGRYSRSPGLAYASELPAPAVPLVLWSSVSCGWFWYTSDGSGHFAELGFSDASVSLARPLLDTVLSVSWSRLGL